MKTALKTSTPVRLVTDCLVIAVAAKNKFSPEAKEIDIASGKRLARACSKMATLMAASARR